MITFTRTFVALMLCLLVLVVSCQSPKPTTNISKPDSIPVVTTPINSDETQCKSPRRQMCTKIYKPVCATQDTGVRCVTTPCPSTKKVTKSNACTACADEKVLSYSKGACG